MAMKVAEAAGNQLHILYVRKRNITEQISKNISTIMKEKLSYSLQDVFQVWFFWKRLESMWHSKMHLQYTMENDPTMQEIKTILQYGESDEEWTLFFQHMNGKDFVTTLNHNLPKSLLIRVMESMHMDNMEVLRALIYAEKDQLPLRKGASKNMFGIEILKSKTVLLHISEVEITDKDLFMLKRMYVASLQDPTRVESRYEVVWIPVVDKSTPWTQAKQHQFENHQSSMPWYSLYHPSIIDPTVIMYIEEVW
ncbi:hypothetical protein Patl1_33326 [Pistacia atlantica]|uniref:Uncharacterized protein n=1 Tax=Pistacia atlantica TaxID=434234 RepID=A0ACC0ZVR3_9ROSI|nr:hypothetical protein Patl1_33326 [Pistacia atlantica]